MPPYFGTVLKCIAIVCFILAVFGVPWAPVVMVAIGLAALTVSMLPIVLLILVLDACSTPIGMMSELSKDNASVCGNVLTMGGTGLAGRVNSPCHKLTIEANRCVIEPVVKCVEESHPPTTGGVRRPLVK